jgi:hypothetical protein
MSENVIAPEGTKAKGRIPSARMRCTVMTDGLKENGMGNEKDGSQMWASRQ